MFSFFPLTISLLSMLLCVQNGWKGMRGQPFDLAFWYFSEFDHGVELGAGWTHFRAAPIYLKLIGL
jgi:hypothetical protein